MIKLGFIGAAGEATGWCHVRTNDRARVMIDMGIRQGESGRQVQPPFARKLVHAGSLEALRGTRPAAMGLGAR